jgi:hypothetical protein
MFLNGSFDSQYLENERYNYELLLLILAFVAVEFQNHLSQFQEKNSWLKLSLCLIAIVALGTFEVTTRTLSIFSFKLSI